jgi:hypothetical protein
MFFSLTIREFGFCVDSCRITYFLLPNLFFNTFVPLRKEELIQLFEEYNSYKYSLNPPFLLHGLELITIR